MVVAAAAVRTVFADGVMVAAWVVVAAATMRVVAKWVVVVAGGHISTAQVEIPIQINHT
jgi:hypothetical protein